jgi:hypothetical protein
MLDRPGELTSDEEGSNLIGHLSIAQSLRGWYVGSKVCAHYDVREQNVSIGHPVPPTRAHLIGPVLTDLGNQVVALDGLLVDLALAIRFRCRENGGRLLRDDVLQVDRGQLPTSLSALSLKVSRTFAILFMTFSR